MIVRGLLYGVFFPPEETVDTLGHALDAAFFEAHATHVTVHIPWVEFLTRYWVEWCDNIDWAGTVHNTYPVQFHTGFNEQGDVYVRDVTGFAPESTWYFRVCGSSDGEMPGNGTGEQWND